MTTSLFWVESPGVGRLAIAARPRGGDWLDDEIAGWRRAGVGGVVSLLTPDEVAEFGLAGEADACRRHGVRFESFAVEDRDVPVSRAEFMELAGRLVVSLSGGEAVAIHCRQGIGRAGLLAASMLMILGLDAETAAHCVGAARGRPVPETPEQMRWLAEFAASPDLVAVRRS